jgi:hypothetical protein
MDAAGELRDPLHAATHRTLIELMAVTGIRLGEAIGLDRDDVDERHQLLWIVDTKFGKSREVVLRASAMDALHAYGRLRDRLSPRPCLRSVLGLDRRHPAVLVMRAPRVRAARAVRRADATIAARPTAPARPQAQLCGAHAVGLARRRRRRPGPAALAVDLHGPRQPGEHLLLPDRRARIARARRPMTRPRSERTVMTALAPNAAARQPGELRLLYGDELDDYIKHRWAPEPCGSNRGRRQ